MVHEAFRRIQDGPNRWAATLRWLCFSDTTLLLAATEANRVLRQLSLGGQAAMQAGLHFAFEVESLGNKDEGVMPLFCLLICAAQVHLPYLFLSLHC